MKEEIVKVKWIDAQRIELGVIQDYELKELVAIPCEIVGFLVHEDKERIIVAQEKWESMGLSDHSGVKYVHVIPKMSVLKIVKLRGLKK